MSASAALADRSIERIYQKKTQLEHILIRPDTYIGSIEKSTQEMWVVSDEAPSRLPLEVDENSVHSAPTNRGFVMPKMVKKQITFVPGLYKIFDEILVNAADNKQRDRSMSTIKVDINPADCIIRIYNDGKGIPVTMHKKENVFVPTLIFGHLLTSSNFDDNQRKVTGGRNGYGAKLCNVFSSEFIVETSCNEFKKFFRQIWRKNMSSPDNPEIEPARDKDFTRITFKPDLERFNMTSLDEDIVSLFKRRVYDIAASCPGVLVYLNGKRLPIKSFEDYVKLYIKDDTNELTGQPLSLVYQKFSDRWEVAVTSSDVGFQQMSFVNSIATTKGGKHVDYITDQIVNKMLDTVKRKNKTGAEIKAHQLKSHLWIFINCLIENPAFDSQTKEFMTLASKSFGSKCEVGDDFVKRVRDKCGTVESVLRWAEFKQQTLLQKKGGGSKTSKLKGIAKLDDANDAGTKNSIHCTLIVTEGDSAKTLAVSGLGVVGRDRYGVFPLRGKLLNVREANSTQIMNNAEITNLCKILGLQYKEQYDHPDKLRQLRYGKLMIMADQDQDGSHIKGLVINFIHHNWPNLIKYGFIEEFITPIVKAFKGNNELLFYSLPEFEEWQQRTEDWMRWRIKYYKGLGTSTSKEAKEYFTDMLRHRIAFNYAGPRDDLALQLAFSKTLIEERKDWLTRWMDERKRRRDENLPEDYLYRKETRIIDYNSFVNKELVFFSNLDNERSLPCMVDGLKPGQRKVLFACFKRNLVKEIKVAQLAGSVAELSSYHHGEQSLMGTIINLAFDFVGSNNINLLLPIGQFGTRIMGGKDASSARYIFTALNPLTRFIFSKKDDPILNYINDDGQYVEPEWYCPIIPMALINGADGIGTGWSTKVPNFNPKDIIAAIRALIAGKEPQELLPFYRNFRGTIEKVDQTKVITNGEVSILDDQTIEISELPIGVWTQHYKDNVIESLLTGSPVSGATSKAATDSNRNKKSKAANRKRGGAAATSRPNAPLPTGEDNERRATAGSGNTVMISDYKEYNTDTTVRFVIKVTTEQMRRIKSEGFHKVFRLQKPISLSNMVMFDGSGRLRRYESAVDVLKDFFKIRLNVYTERKRYHISQLTAESLRLDNMARFILEKIEGKIKVENVKKAAMLEELKKRKYDPDPVNEWRLKIAKSKTSVADALQREQEAAEQEAATDESEQRGSVTTSRTDYDYLLGMPLWSLTMERKDDILKQQSQKAEDLSKLKAKTERQLWLDDLELLEQEIDKEESKAAAANSATAVSSKGGKRGQLGGNNAKNKASKINPNTLPSEFGERVIPPQQATSTGSRNERSPGSVPTIIPFLESDIAAASTSPSSTSQYIVKRSELVTALMDLSIPDQAVLRFVTGNKTGNHRKGANASAIKKDGDVRQFLKRKAPIDTNTNDDNVDEEIIIKDKPKSKKAALTDSEESSDNDETLKPAPRRAPKRKAATIVTRKCPTSTSESDFSLDDLEDDETYDPNF